MDLTIDCAPKKKLCCRVVFLAMRENAILAHKDKKAGYYYLPGGRIHYHEDSISAIHREVAEELQIDIQDPKLAAVMENFFFESTLKENFHELCFMYRIVLPDNFEPPEMEMDGTRNEWRWIDKDDWHQLDVKPQLSSEQINTIFNASDFVHIIHHD